MANLNSNLKEISGVGEKTSATLKKLGLNSVLDLLFYFPFRYESIENNKKISELKVGESVKVQGEIELIESKRARKKKLWLTEALINDGEETLKVIWFNQPYLAKSLRVGERLSLSGKISESYGQITMISPEFERIKADEEIVNYGDKKGAQFEKNNKAQDDNKNNENEKGAQFENNNRAQNENGKKAQDENNKEAHVNNNELIPVYHLSAGYLSQKILRNTIKKVLSLASGLKEWLPSEIVKELKLISLEEAIYSVHFPKNEAEIKTAKQRLTFSNLFLRQLKSQAIKRELKNKTAPKIIFNEDETRKFVETLPFKLTDGQKNRLGKF